MSRFHNCIFSDFGPNNRNTRKERRRKRRTARFFLARDSSLNIKQFTPELEKMNNEDSYHVV